MLKRSFYNIIINIAGSRNTEIGKIGSPNPFPGWKGSEGCGRKGFPAICLAMTRRHSRPPALWMPWKFARDTRKMNHCRGQAASTPHTRWMEKQYTMLYHTGNSKCFFFSFVRIFYRNLYVIDLSWFVVKSWGVYFYS